jgi:hypothetical protein
MEYIIGIIFLAIVAVFLLTKKKPEVISEIVEEVKTAEKAVEAVVVEKVKAVRKPRAAKTTTAVKKKAPATAKGTKLTIVKPVKKAAARSKKV